MEELHKYLWVVEHLDGNDNPSDWKQSLSTLAFMMTEPYGKGLKETLLIPYLKKALDSSNDEIKKVAVRFIISLKSFDLLTEADIQKDIIAETFYEKYLRAHNPAFLKPLKITFMKLEKEKKLERFLKQLGEGEFSRDIIRELTFQLDYRSTQKIEEALNIIEFLIHKMGIKKEGFIPFLENFIKELPDRIYLLGKNKVKNYLKNRAEKIISA